MSPTPQPHPVLQSSSEDLATGPVWPLASELTPGAPAVLGGRPVLGATSVSVATSVLVATRGSSRVAPVLGSSVAAFTGALEQGSPP